jgi:hypothetical protein
MVVALHHRSTPFLAALALILLVGCMTDRESETVVDSGRLEATVLQPGDLPEPFVSFDEGPLQSADGPRGERGWKARYRRPGSPRTSGPLVVESRVDSLDNEDAAARALGELAEELEERGAAKVDPPSVGDDTVAFREREDAVNPVIFFRIVWRHANVLASLTISGFAGRVRLGEAAALARKQQARLVGASDS